MEQNKENFLNRVNKVMPHGVSSTNSKSPRFLPEEPVAIDRGKGCRVWDMEDREFIDFRNGLGPVTLGYRFPEVDKAIEAQLAKGIVYGHPHHLEFEVAERLTELIPCAEQVRFLKTGGEALAACIRLARYYTERDHIIQIGYNGWVNNLSSNAQVLPGHIAESGAPGIPDSLGALHHTCAWNDMQRLESLFLEHPGEIAAIVVAADYENMEAGHEFYPYLRELTNKNDCLLIFDEIVTGFRIAIGGVQEYFNVTPDLAVFSKGIANGMPLSAFVGKQDIMSGCDKVIISSTFGGEALSLAAAKAALSVYTEQGVIEHLWRQGKKLWQGVNRLFSRYHIPMEVKGFWPCPLFAVDSEVDPSIRDVFFRAAYQHGVSLYNVSYVNFSHQDTDITDALSRLEQACQFISKKEGIV